MTTAVLVTLRMLSRGDDSGELGQVELLITLAYAITLVVSAPIHVVVSRYAADRLYEERLDLVADPLRRALTGTLIGFLALGAVVMAVVGPPTAIAIPAAVLTAIVAAQWLLLGVGGGMSAPAGVLKAFGIGAVTSVLLAIAFERAFGLGARGYLFGFTLGQAVALVTMLVRILRDLPAEESRPEPGSMIAAFREYKLLAASAMLVYLAVWIDKVIAWVFDGSGVAHLLSSASALAWFAVIPAFAWIYIQVETAFYRMFRRYFGGIESGAGLDELEASARDVHVEAGRLMRGAMGIQLVVLLLGVLAAPHIVRELELAEDATVVLRLSLVAASLQVMTLLGLLLLYYLDLRREACQVALTQLVSIAATTLFARWLGAPLATGAAFGSFIPAMLALWTVRRAVSTLVPDTFQSQPYGSLT